MTRLQSAVSFLLLMVFGFSYAQQRSTATLNVLVLRESNGKPVRNAEVVLHLLDKDGKERQDSIELKTHEDGKAEAGGVPYGRWRVQVIAKGFQTYGNDQDIQQPQLDLTIKLQKPKDQFSIYK